MKKFSFSPLLRISFALILGLLLVSCDQGGNDSGENLSPTESKRQIQASVDDLGDNFTSLEDGEFSSSFKTFLGLQDGETMSDDWAETVATGLSSVLETSSGRFDFDASRGEYDWDPAAEEWVEAGPSGDVVLNFPASQGAGSNNATLTISGYDDTQVVVDGETVYLPTDGSASLTVDGTEVFRIGLSGASFTMEDNLEASVPQAFDLTILTAPHEHILSLSGGGSSDVSFTYELRDDGELVTGLALDVMLATDDYGELQESDVDQVSGEIALGPDVVIPYTVNVGELASFDDPTEEQINNRIDAVVEYRGQEIATLRYDKDSEEFEVVYSDGSVDPASEFYDDFLDEMEGAWSDYLGDDDLEVDLNSVQKSVGSFFRQ